MELLILLAIIMLHFGAKRVPEFGRSLGESMREFRKGATEEPQVDTTCTLDEKKQLSERR